jgi:hypothetical protein
MRISLDPHSICRLDPDPDPEGMKGRKKRSQNTDTGNWHKKVPVF